MICTCTCTVLRKILRTYEVDDLYCEKVFKVVHLQGKSTRFLNDSCYGTGCCINFSKAVFGKFEWQTKQQEKINIIAHLYSVANFYTNHLPLKTGSLENPIFSNQVTLLPLTLLLRRSISIWFLYDNGLRHERVNAKIFIFREG